MRIVVFFTLLFTCVACKKAEDRRCLKAAGGHSSKEIFLGNFSELDLGPHIEFSLVQDSTNKMVISGPKNLLNFISSDISGGKLRVWNENKCNFLRSYKKTVHVTIHLQNINKIKSQVSKSLNCLNQLITGNLEINLFEGSGLLNLHIKSNELQMSSQGYTRAQLTGEANYFNLRSIDASVVDAFQLNAIDSVNLQNHSSGTLRVRTNNGKLGAQISSIGSVWYKGTPNPIQLLQYGTGQLVDKN